jgi:hypothetical protein
MTLEPMEEYFRDRVTIEAKGSEWMQASLTFTPDLQGPPAAGHGGGVTAMLFELVRLIRDEQGGAVRVPRPVRVEAVLHRELPLQTPLVAEVAAADGGWRSRILQGERPIAEAMVRPMESLLPPVPPEVRQEWDAPRGRAHEVPGYAFCLACGLRNPRGVQVRFDFNEGLVWKRLQPQPHFRCADGSLFPGYLCIVCDEIGWWLGALRQGECGLSNRVTVCLGQPVVHGVPLLALGARSGVTTSDPKGRVWQTRATIVTPDWQPVAAAEVQFAGSRAFSKMMLPGFVPGEDPEAVRRVFPGYAGPRGVPGAPTAPEERGAGRSS